MVLLLNSHLHFSLHTHIFVAHSIKATNKSLDIAVASNKCWHWCAFNLRNLSLSLLSFALILIRVDIIKHILNIFIDVVCILCVCNERIKRQENDEHCTRLKMDRMLVIVDNLKCTASQQQYLNSNRKCLSTFIRCHDQLRYILVCWLYWVRARDFASLSLSKLITWNVMWFCVLFFLSFPFFYDK